VLFKFVKDSNRWEKIDINEFVPSNVFIGPVYIYVAGTITNTNEEITFEGIKKINWHELLNSNLNVSWDNFL